MRKWVFVLLMCITPMSMTGCLFNRWVTLTKRMPDYRPLPKVAVLPVIPAKELEPLTPATRDNIKIMVGELKRETLELRTIVRKYHEFRDNSTGESQPAP